MKKMSKGMLMTALICGAVYLGGSPVYANELQEFALDEYVVTAARTETKLVDTPANISVVDAKTIEERHYQDVSEVLKDVPGANIMDSGSGAYEKVVSLNGDTRVLILIDGRRVDLVSGTSTGRGCVDMNLLPNVELIERIEILKGAGGALYGSDAVGGVINIITKKADIDYGKINIGYGSFGIKDYSAMYSARKNKTGFVVTASKNEQDYYKYKDAKTRDKFKWSGGSKMNSEKLSFKIDHELSNTSNFEVGYDYSKYDGLSSGSLSNYYGVSDSEKDSNNIYAKLNWEDYNNNQGYIQIYHNEYNYYTVGAPDNPYYANILWGDVNEKTIGVDVQQEFKTVDNNKLVAGISWRESDVLNVADRIDYTGQVLLKRGDVYDESIKNTAIYLNDTWEISSSWILNTGVRYDDNSKSGNETTFSAGLNKKFSENSHAYVNWGEVFKAPTTGDLFAVGMGNPNLKAEKGNSWTVGYATKVNNNTDLNINYFESDLKDAIAWSKDNNGFWSVDNVAKQKKNGAELSIKHSINDNLDLIASYTYIKVKNDNNDGRGYLRDWNYMPNTYRLGVRYHKHKLDANIWLRAANGGATHTYKDIYGSDKISYLDNNYWTVDMAITYKATTDLSLYVKAYNIFDEAYAEQAGVDIWGSGSYDYPAQSRRFIVGAEYKF